ncbi:hypothetical protein ABR737_40825 [Streptomyces sp. Edi2]|uniref:hypothetical protein n=1 Tax=Streptomyces sp. Edi2 TaxID=3162528 RepID=UPI003305F837
MLTIESAELRIAVGPQSDARLDQLFDDTCATVVRTALEQEQAQPGDRQVVYNPIARLSRTRPAVNRRRTRQFLP